MAKRAIQQSSSKKKQIPQDKPEGFIDSQIVEWQILSSAFGKSFFEVLSADGDVSFVTSDLNLFAVADRFPMGIYSENHSRLASTMAYRFDLVERICPGHQMVTTLEEIALEVRAQAICQYRDIQVVADVAELPDLLLGQELGFIDKHTMHNLFTVLLLNTTEQIIGWRDGNGIRLQADSRADFPNPKSIVDLGREDKCVHAPLSVVVTRLEQYRRLARIHGGIIKKELGQLGHSSVRLNRGWLGDRNKDVMQRWFDHFEMLNISH